VTWPCCPDRYEHQDDGGAANTARPVGRVFLVGEDERSVRADGAGPAGRVGPFREPGRPARRTRSERAAEAGDGGAQGVLPLPGPAKRPSPSLPQMTASWNGNSPRRRDSLPLSPGGLRLAADGRAGRVAADFGTPSVVRHAGRFRTCDRRVVSAGERGHAWRHSPDCVYPGGAPQRWPSGTSEDRNGARQGTRHDPREQRWPSGTSEDRNCTHEAALACQDGSAGPPGPARIATVTSTSGPSSAPAALALRDQRGSQQQGDHHRGPAEVAALALRDQRGSQHCPRLGAAGRTSRQRWPSGTSEDRNRAVGRAAAPHVGQRWPSGTSEDRNIHST
jgi:hypothetical protein